MRKKETVACKQQLLYTIFDRPSLLVGVKICNRFKESDGSLKWYKGLITTYKRQQFAISYDGSAESYQFTIEEIQEDFCNGDFYVE